MFRSRGRSALLGAALTCIGIAGAGPASALSLGLGDIGVFSGVLTQDAEVGLELVNLTFPGTRLVNFETFSYAGGQLGNGDLVARGGFDPIVSVFDGMGNLLGSNDDGTSRFDAVTGSAFDSGLQLNMTAGNYIAAVTQYDNFALGNSFASGFARAGEGNFTAFLGGCSNGSFCDVTGDNRTPEFTLQVAPVPVPAPLPLLIGGVLALAFAGAARRRAG